MRHLGSLIAGILIAPLAWLLIALGQQKSTTLVAGWAAANRFDTVDLIAPTAYLVGAGVLLGLVATLRLSPLGPLVAGLALLAPTVSLFIAPLSTLDRMPHSVSLGSLHIDPRVPLVNGTLPVIGVLLVVAVFSVKRWRQWPVLATDTAEEEQPVEPVGEETVSPYAPGYGGGTAEQPTTVASGWAETPSYTVPPVPEPAYGAPTTAYVPTPPGPTSPAAPTSPADTTVTAPWVAPSQRSGTQTTSGVSDYESEPPPLPSRAGRPSPRPRHAASGTGEFPTLAQVGPVDRLAEAQRHAAAQTAAAGAAYQAQFEPAATDAEPTATVTEADQQAIAEANRRTLAEAQAEASRRAAAELHAEAERRAQAETQRRAQARAQAEAQREADQTRTPPWPSTAPTSPARTETYWPAGSESPAAEAEPEEDSAETTRLPDSPGGLRPEFTQPTSPAATASSPAVPSDSGPVWPAEDPGQPSADDEDEARAEAEREERAAQAERERVAAQAEAERRAALLAEAERRAQERVRNPPGDEPPASPWSAPPRSR